MATSTGSLASQFGAMGGGHSPVKARESQLRTTSAIDLVEQIRKLELEGLKLRSEHLEGGAGITVGSNLDALDLGISSPIKTDSPKFTSTSPSSLSALVDIAAEQKTIDELRQQLEAQRRESERLHQTLLGDRFSSGSSATGPLFRISSSPSRTGFSTLPSTDLFSSSRRGAHSNIETGPPSHLEKALKDSQEQVTDLRRRLAESNEMSEQQKRQFRQNIEELKAKLQESFTNRDSLLELRQKEAAKHGSQIAQLQASLQHLQDKCRAQEQALIEAGKKADGYHRENYITETTINQMRLILADSERRRGKPYFDNDPVSAQNPSMLVHTLERCIQELTRDAEARKSRNEELEKELKDLKQDINKDQETLTKEHQQKEEENVGLLKRIAQMTTENDRQLQAANERASNTRKQAANLQSQLTMLQGQYEQQMKIKEEMVNDLENKVRHLRNEHSEDRVKWQEQKESLEKSLDQLQKELTLLRSNRDETLRNQAALETKLAELQGAYGKASQELEEEKKNVSKHWEREGELRLRQTDLESRLEEKHRDIERLEKMLNMVRQECNATVSEKVSNIEKQERERHLEKISTLTAQLSEASEKCNRQTLAAEKAQMELTNIKQQMRELSDKFETTRIQYEAAAAEKKHLTDMLSAKTSDYDRLSQERDYYFNLIEQKNSEITQLQAQRERLTVQLEEKEKNLLLLKQQSDNFSQLVEANSRSSDTIREERELLAKKLKETTDALEELRTSREVMSKKMKLREKRIRDLEEEKHKVIEEMDLRKQEMAILKEEKDTLFKELKESRYEVANLTEERDTLKRNMANQKYNLEKELERYKEKFKAIDHDMKLTQKAIKKQESVDNRAVKVADKMQKEITAKRGQIDSLQSRVRWLEEKIDSQSRTRASLESDKERLKTSLNKALLQNQELSADLEVANSRSDDLRAQVKKLETSLEKFQPIEKILHKAFFKKATVRQASSQAQLEQFEQELTRLKLKHQLDVKEAVQKVNRTLSEGGRYPQIFSTEPTTSSQVQQATEIPPLLASPRKVTQSAEEYKEIGHELKNLLQELKGVLSDKKDNNYRPTSQFTGGPVRQENVKLEYEDGERPVDREISWPLVTKETVSQPSAVLLRPVLQSSYAPPSYPSQPTCPTQFNYQSPDYHRNSRGGPNESSYAPPSYPTQPTRSALSNYQFPNYHRFMSSAAITRKLNYHTDHDVDERQRRTRSKSMAAADLAELSGHRDTRPRSASPVQQRQRSRSAEISLVLPKSGTFVTNGDKLASEMSEDFLSTFVPSEFDMKEKSYSTGYGKNVSGVSHDPTEPISLPDNSNFSTSLGLNSHVEENTKGFCDAEPVSPARRVPDTHELCRRLEEKILHLSKMGNTLQKENKEMADIINDQGKKLKKVKETEKKFRKPTR